MYYAFIISQFITVLILAVEAGVVFMHLNTRMHGYLFLYLIANMVNGAGYLLEITSKTSESIYVATKMLYLGKVFIPVGLFLFVLMYCRVEVPRWGRILMLSFHMAVWLLIFTNDYHHLYYSSVTYVNEGFFPHNVYGHGPLYYVYQAIPLIYSAVGVIIAVRGMTKMPSKVERRQLRFMLEAPIFSIIGFILFLTGKTGGYDTTNLGFFLASIFMLISLFKYDLVDTADMVKNDMIDDLEDPIIATDAFGRLAYLNTRAQKLFPNLKEGIMAESNGIISDLRARADSKTRFTIDDSTFAVINKELVFKELFRGNLYILDDITESVKYTNEVEAEKERAIEANEAKSLFLSSMSHEIRTPMNAIVGITDIMLRDNLPPDDMEYLRNIRSSGAALLDIINDILDISKIESGKMEIVCDEYEPLTMINDLKVIFLTRVGEKPIHLSFEIDKELPAKLYGDQVRIRQTIINLMNNAIKYTDVGYVKMTVTAERIGDDKINLGISVKDSGLGIREEDVNKLFDSFSQVDPKKNHAKEGTGLGLSITKQLVELMGGTIGVRSEYGQGSEFYYTIPQTVVDYTPAEKFEYTSREKDDVNFVAPNAKILLVEDNELNVKVTVGLLAPTRIQIDVAENGMVALRKVTDNKYDLVLMDHMMPVMDGIEATEKIRNFEGSYYANIPIIALSANAISGAVEEFHKVGMNDFIGKPIDVNELKAKIRKWLPDDLVNESVGTKQEEETSPKSNGFEDVTNGEESNMKEGYGTLDRDLGIQYCGTEELYNEVLKDFYTLIDDKANKIQRLLDEGNIHDYTIEVHALKSTARMLGATPLSELSFEMEMAGKSDNVDLIKAKTPTLLEMYRAYKETLSFFDDDEPAKESVNVEKIKSELSRMLNAANEFDVDEVDDAMLKISGFMMPDEETSTLVKQLNSLVRDVAFEEVKTKIVQILGRL